MTERKSATGKIIGAIVLIVIVALAAWWYFSRMPGLDLSRRGPAPSAPATASTAPAPIEHPIEQAEAGPAPASTAPLPPLGNSDDAAVAALGALPGAEGLGKLLIARGLVPHIVATVDALPRHTIGSSILPLRTPQGSFTTSMDDGHPVIDPKNYARYEPYMKLVRDVDPRVLVRWYVHWYPLFQQSYRELGYPRGYFNDRLIVAIDDMLAAPNARTPVALVATGNGRYDFSDPTWQGLSVGQKLMIRLGPENERETKIKLRQVRALLVGKAPRLTGRPASEPAAAATTGSPQ